MRNKEMSVGEMFAIAALETVKKLQGKDIEKRENIINNYQEEVKKIKDKESYLKKGCPKNTILCLMESNLLKDINVNYSKKSDSVEGKYAMEAIKILKKNEKNYKPRDLWRRVLENLSLDTGKHYDHQMDIVLILWEEGLIV